MAMSAADYMLKYSGYNENNAKQDAALSAFIKQNAGLNIDPASTAWCAAFLNAALGASGQQGTGKLNARSFLNWGDGVDHPQPGDVVVFSRGAPGSGLGHVGIYMGANADGTIQVISGNHGDAVALDNFSTSNVLGYRRGGPGYAQAAMSGQAPDPTGLNAQATYTVQRGDTLAKIAAQQGTTVDAIAKANGITDPNVIKTGQVLHGAAQTGGVDERLYGMLGRGQPSLPPVPNTQVGTPAGTQLGLSNNAPPPIPMPRPMALTSPAQVTAASTGQQYHVGDIIPSRDGSYKLQVVDDGNGGAKFVRQMNPGEIPGVMDPYKAVGPNAVPSLIGNYINSHPEIAGPLTIAKGLGLTANQAANPPKLNTAPVQQAVEQAAGATQATVGNAVKQGQDALGSLGNSAVSMFGNLFNAQKPPAPPPANSGWSTAWQAPPVQKQAIPNTYLASPQPTQAQLQAIRAVAPPSPAIPPLPSQFSTPALAPGLTADQKYAMSALPQTPYMPPMMLPNDAMAYGIGIPTLPQTTAASLAPLTHRNIAPAPVWRPVPPPVQMVQIGSGRMVPVGTQGQRNGQGYAVQKDGSILHSGGWSTPAPGQPEKWWQANNPENW